MARSAADDTFARFVAAGLVNARVRRETTRVTVAAHAEAYLARRSDVKPRHGSFSVTWSETLWIVSATSLLPT